MVKTLFISENLGDNSPCKFNSATISMCLTVTSMWMSTHTVFLSPSWGPIPPHPWCTLSCHSCPQAALPGAAGGSRQPLPAPRRLWKKLNSLKKLHFGQQKSFVYAWFIIIINFWWCTFYFFLCVSLPLALPQKTQIIIVWGKIQSLYFFFPWYWLGMMQRNVLSQNECLEILLKTLTSFTELNVVNG